MSMQTSELEPRCPKCNKNKPSDTHWCYGLADCDSKDTSLYLHGCSCCEECSEACAKEAKYPASAIIIEEES